MTPPGRAAFREFEPDSTDISGICRAELDNAIARARLLGGAISVGVLARLSRMKSCW